MEIATLVRVIQDPPLDGPTNMARDEALMNSVGDGQSPPTLRLYQWIEPTISLGYFQKYADFEALPKPLSQLAVVRRPTGGGAILHDLELTYSIAFPITHPLLASECCPNGVRDFRKLYKVAHDAIFMALRELKIESTPSGFTDDSGPARGPFFCFARRHEFDLLVGEEKIVGSAQRRTRQAVLQHGSIILANRFDQPIVAPPMGPGTGLPHYKGGTKGGLPEPHIDLAAVADRIAQLRLALLNEFGSASNLTCEQADWSADELALVPKIRSKYSGDEWMRRI